MDTSDPTIEFDSEGICNYCNNFDNNIKPNWDTRGLGNPRFKRLVEKIRSRGRKREYDCILGISGGLDSSYAAYVAKDKLGLRPLLYHCDAGWNTDVSTSNIQSIVDGLGLDLVTDVINWEEMKDLQRAFFRSQVPFQDTPQDLGLFSSLYKFASKHGFQYVLTGGNISTECVRECLDWTYFSTDLTQVKAIHRRFGEKKLKTFPMCDILEYRIKYRLLNKMKVVKILDYVRYNKNDAIKTLEERFGWKRYSQKHYESRFTRFYESYWTPNKFGFDKRRVYFSSEILTCQLTRDEALNRLRTSQLDEHTMEKDFEFVASKLDWTVDEFRSIFMGDNKSHRDYPNKERLLSLATNIYNILGIDNRTFR